MKNQPKNNIIYNQLIMYVITKVFVNVKVIYTSFSADHTSDGLPFMIRRT
jgi:hypothetical protein